MAWYEEHQSQYIKFGIGKEIEVTIKEVKKITDKEKFDFKDKAGLSQGYHYNFITDKGILTVNTWALLSVLRDGLVREGDRVRLKHTDKGKYFLTMVEKYDPTSPVVPKKEAKGDEIFGGTKEPF